MAHPPLPAAPLPPPPAGDFRTALSYDFETAVSPRASYHTHDPWLFPAGPDAAALEHGASGSPRGSPRGLAAGPSALSRGAGGAPAKSVSFAPGSRRPAQEGSSVEEQEHELPLLVSWGLPQLLRPAVCAEA